MAYPDTSDVIVDLPGQQLFSYVLMTSQDCQISRRVTVIVLGINVHAKHKMLFGKVLGRFEMAVSSKPMNRRVPFSISTVETSPFCMPLFQRFQLSLLGGQVHVLVIFYKCANPLYSRIALSPSAPSACNGPISAVRFNR